MIRAYVVTFAFVFFRLLSDYGPTSRLQPENHQSIIITWVCWVVPLAVTEMMIKQLGFGSMIYAGLFLTEGIGLWLQKRWAEWLTAVITGSLIPLEL